MTGGNRRGADERQRRIAQRLAVHRRREKRRRRFVGLAVALVLVALVTGVTVGVLRAGNRAAASGTGVLGPEGIPLENGAVLASIAGAAQGRLVDGIRCDASEQVAYHIHAHLAVFVNGRPRSIPYGIGIVTPAVTRTAQGPFAEASRCYYWLHTHTGDGVIHVESPTQRQYTLGDFFDIWQQPLGATRVAAVTGTVTAYVDGRRYTGDPRGIVLREHEDIQLDVGKPIMGPQPVNWSASRL